MAKHKARNSDHDRKARRIQKLYDERGATLNEEGRGCYDHNGKVKIQYLDRTRARRVADDMNRTDPGRSLRAYRCGGHYHVGHDDRAKP